MKNKITHPLERYKLIADPTIRQQCIDNFDEGVYNSSKYRDKGSVDDAVDCGFLWQGTPQGAEYWLRVCERIIEGTLPLLPEPIEDNPTFNLNEAINVTKDGYKLTEIDQLRSENEKLREFIQFFANKYDAIEEDDMRVSVFKEERFKAKQLLNK